jgi:hypothetical protein
MSPCARQVPAQSWHTKSLDRAELPQRYRPAIALLLAFSLGSLGFLVAVYLAVSGAA